MLKSYIFWVILVVHFSRNIRLKNEYVILYFIIYQSIKPSIRTEFDLLFAYYQRYLQIIIYSIVQKNLRHKVDLHLNFRFHISVQFYFRNQLRRQSKLMHLYIILKLLFWLREFWNNCLWSLSQSQSSSNWQRFATFYQLQINTRSLWPDFFGHFDVLIIINICE